MHRYQPNLHIVVHAEGPGLTCRSFTFPNTAFMAVTAYQNHRVSNIFCINSLVISGILENSCYFL